MIKLRTFVILSTLIVVFLALIVSWAQMKSVLEKGSHTLEEKELDHISQVVRAVIETKKSELKNYTQMIRSNNDLSSAYLMAKESGNIDLIDAKLVRIKNEIRFDFAEILTPQGKTIHSYQPDADAETLKRITEEKEGLFSAVLFGKPALISFSPLTLYDEPIGTFVLGYFLEGAISQDLSKLTNADVTFKIAAPMDIKRNETELAQGKLSFSLEDTGLAPLLVTIHLRENPADSFWKIFSGRLILSVVISLSVLLLALYCFLEFGFIREFRTFVDEVKTASYDVDHGEPRELPIGRSRIFESNLLFKTTQKLVTSLIAYQRRMKKQVLLEEAATKQKALGELASQVAHDIRSPLSALLMATNNLAQLPEQNRLLIRGAVSRIQDIANNLLTKRREIENEPVPGSLSGKTEPDSQSVQLLSSLIENIISEKRMQIRQRMGIHIEAMLDHDSYGLFASVQSTAFKTIISNLLNNSVEAMDGAGSIFVYLHDKVSAIEVSIEDNGRGISKDLLPKLAQRGGSFNKEHGSGLGLYHARTCLESWGGGLQLDSTVGVGTKVTLTVPKARPPQWFVPHIDLTLIDTIVIVDDDVSIHHIWEKRFETSKRKPHILNFSTPRQLLNWKPIDNQSRILYLIDYEFLGEIENGLSLIEALAIEERSILVTSRFEEPEIMERCRTKSIRLIPKGMAGFVPIQFDSVKMESDLPHRESLSVFEKDVSRHDQL